MMKIVQFPLGYKEQQVLRISEDHEILSVGTHNPLTGMAGPDQTKLKPAMVAMVGDGPEISIKIAVLETGQTVPEGCEYLGSTSEYSSGKSWHIFRID